MKSVPERDKLRVDGVARLQRAGDFLDPNPGFRPTGLHPGLYMFVAFGDER